MIPHTDPEALTGEPIDAISDTNMRGPFVAIRAFAALMLLPVSPGAVDTAFVPGRTTRMVERAAHAAEARRSGNEWLRQ